MTTRTLVSFSCDGCLKEAEGKRWMRRGFDSFGSETYGVVYYKHDTPQDVAPEGWIASDPYTGCCYCPDCWKEIVDAD